MYKLLAFTCLYGWITLPEYGSAFMVPTSSHMTTSTTLLTTTTTTTTASKEQLRMFATPTGKENNKVLDCLVIGGGISGSTLAHNLNKNGVKVLLAEARDYLGGNVKSHRTEDGFLWEEGPNSYATQPSIIRIACELGIQDQLVFADESLPPWVNHNGKLHPLPKGKGGKGPKGQVELVFGPNGVLKFALAGQLLSWPGKIRAGIGAFVGHAPKPEGKEETIREWVTRILGEEVFLRCIDPFVSGVYAGNPETLSMKAALPKIARIEEISYTIDWNVFGAIFYGGLKRQIELTKERKADPPEPEWPEFEYGNPGSFREGLATLPNAIMAELGPSKIKLQWKALNIVRKSNTADENDGHGQQYVVTFDTPDGIQSITTRTIVSTTPAHSIGPVLETIMPESKDIFQKVRKEIDRIGVYHPPVAAVTVAYPTSSFKDVELPNGFGNLQSLPGFGSLNPRTEGVRTLGTLWSSSLFPGRTPPGYNLLLNYIGGSRDVGIGDLTNEQIIEQVDIGCRQVLLKPDAPPPKVIGMKVWPTAIPQYELGHLPLIKELELAESMHPGLWVTGNYRTGVAFPDCVTFGYDHAKIVKTYLEEEEKKRNEATRTKTTTTTTSSSVRQGDDRLEAKARKMFFAVEVPKTVEKKEQEKSVLVER
jgi:oxygen-dependent protoporphyrinogen oxidase